MGVGGRKVLELLMECYYDGKSIADTIKFVERCYGEEITDRLLIKAIKVIESCGGSWE